MRDGATGRSRGFGFLTFRDPKTVNTVMVKEHFLDGKIVRASLSDDSLFPPPSAVLQLVLHAKRIPFLFRPLPLEVLVQLTYKIM